MPIDESPIHKFFGLSYANYFVCPRSVLQSMPVEWQKRFLSIMEELDESIDWVKDDREYHVIQTECVEREHDDDIDYKVTHYFNLCSGEMGERQIEVLHDEFLRYRHVRHELKKIPPRTDIY